MPWLYAMATFSWNALLRHALSQFFFLALSYLVFVLSQFFFLALSYLIFVLSQFFLLALSHLVAPCFRLVFVEGASFSSALLHGFRRLERDLQVSL
jgi:hypothetical protein